MEKKFLKYIRTITKSEAYMFVDTIQESLSDSSFLDV